MGHIEHKESHGLKKKRNMWSLSREKGSIKKGPHMIRYIVGLSLMGVPHLYTALSSESPVMYIMLNIIFIYKYLDYI